jgi:hypothetical protein
MMVMMMEKQGVVVRFLPGVPAGKEGEKFE